MLRKLSVGALLVVLVVGTACDDGGDPDERSFPVREPNASPTSETGPVIALVGTLSGPDMWRGNDAFEGVEPAIQALNRDLEDTELPFTLVGRDDEGDPILAADLVAEFAADERTVGVVYAGPPQGLPSAEAALAQAGIPAILVHGDLYSAHLLRPHIFQSSPPYLWQARRIATYFFRDRRYTKIGVLAERSLMGDTALGSIRTGVDDVAGRVAAQARYLVGDDDFTAELEVLKKAKVEAIVFHGSPTAAQTLFEGLTSLDATYVSTDAARLPKKKKGSRNRSWRPQIAGLDAMISPLSGGEDVVPPGTIATDTYARGAHYLPLASFEGFREAFVDWWDSEPLGWQRRAYEAALLVGWAARRTPPGGDAAAQLEKLNGARFGGLEVSFGPDDHTATIQTTVGLWVVPRSGVEVPEREDLDPEMPWVPLARGFSTGGERTDVLPQDWKELFAGTYRLNGPAPRFIKASFGVATKRNDPVH